MFLLLPLLLHCHNILSIYAILYQLLYCHTILSIYTILYQLLYYLDLTPKKRDDAAIVVSMDGWDGGVTTIYFAPDQTDEAPPAQFYFKVREEGGGWGVEV